MSTLKNGLTAEEIQAELQRKLIQMEEKQREGIYMEAQMCRLQVQQLKKDFEIRRLYELKEKQRAEVHELHNTHNEEIESFNEHWNKREQDLREESQNMEKQMSDRHMEEQRNTEAELDEKLPKKVKESSELLNLRKMEEHMAKQKNYVEAHYVQEKCRQMLKDEIIAWENMRNSKIYTAMKTLRNKQELELQALQLRYKTALEEIQTEKIKEFNRIKLKFDNVCKDQKMQHEKEVISHKGQFKSKGGQATSPSMSRSKTIKV